MHTSRRKRLRCWIAAHRNALALALLGVGAIGQGLAVWLESSVIPNPDHAIVYEMWPIWLRLSLWFGCGAAALLLAFTPMRPLGWIAALVMPMERSMSHGWSLAMWLIPGHPPGVETAGPQFIFWTAIALLIYIMSGWAAQPEPVCTKETR